MINRGLEEKASVTVYILSVLSIVLVILYTIYYTNEEQAVLYRRLTEAKAFGYVCLADGVEVDINNIDLNDYWCRIDTVDETIYLTKKEDIFSKLD